MQRQMPRLRTKTGCAPCRRAKKKCDEALPTCRRCQVGGKACQWPDPSELSDGRRLPRRTCSRADDRRKLPDLALNDSALIRATSGRAIETLLSRHFAFGFYELVLLPGCDRYFFKGWLDQLSQLSKTCPSLQNSLLACAASHLYLMNGAETMLQLGLMYYSNAIQQLLKCLSDSGKLSDNDAILSAIIFLIIHGCQGVHTFDDIPNHMGAASRIILDVLKPQGATERCQDAVLVESVLYHSFHACTGLWSDTDPGRYHVFDSSLWRQAEGYLNKVNAPGIDLKSRGPVLGVPTSLLRLAIQLRQLYRDPLGFPTEGIQHLQAECLVWEDQVLFNTELSPNRPAESLDATVAAADDCCRDVSILYVLTVSLLLDEFSGSGVSRQNVDRSRPWQLKIAVEILRKHASNQRWQRSYMGSWPVYTLGSFARNTGARVAFQSDLRRRWELTRMGQSKRFLDDMEKVWAQSDTTSANELEGSSALDLSDQRGWYYSPGTSSTYQGMSS